jgi:HEPN domain-containing protein
MQKEIQRWLQMASDDLDSSESNFINEKYYVSAFLSQQAVEKALKAFLIKRDQVLIKTHNLFFWGKKAGLSDDLLDKCELLSDVYIETRYGSVYEEVPSRLFNRENTREFFEIAKEIVQWVENNI